MDNIIEITEQYVIDALIDIKEHMMFMSFQQYSQEVMDVAIEAVHKQIPKKMVHHYVNVFSCPTCKYISSYKYYPKYCDNCGQMLDWGDFNKR